MNVVKCPSSVRITYGTQDLWPWCQLLDGHPGSHYAESQGRAVVWSDEDAWTADAHRRGAS